MSRVRPQAPTRILAPADPPLFTITMRMNNGRRKIINFDGYFLHEWQSSRQDRLSEKLLGESIVKWSLTFLMFIFYGGSLFAAPSICNVLNQAVAKGSSPQKLHHFLTQQWKYYMVEEPEFATSVGYPGQ